MTWSQYTAEQIVAMAALALDASPALAGDLARGHLDWAKLKMLNEELGDVEPGQLGVVVDALRHEFDRCTVGQLRERLRRLVLQVDPEAARRRRLTSVARRRVEHREFANGTAMITSPYLATEAAAGAWSHIDALARACKASGDTDRNLNQIRADVFADLLQGVDPGIAGRSSPSGIGKGTINLHMDLTTLACLNDDPGAIAGFGPVIADVARQTARQMAEAAQWRFTVTDDAVGVVAEGRLRYRPTPRQRAFIAARDVSCRAPGCRRPAMRCEVDHIRDWAKGGLTLVNDLCSLCRFHHRAKHSGGFRLRRRRGGIEWLTPLGRRYLVLPNHVDVRPPADADGRTRQRGNVGATHIRR